MATWALDGSGDWTINNNIFGILTGNYEIIQNVETRVKEQIQDCFFNLNAGINWLNLPKTQSDINDLISTIQNKIAATNGVTAVIDISYTLKDRNLKIIANYKTPYSDINISQFLFDL